MVEKETQEIVGQKRRARTGTTTSTSSSKGMVADSVIRRSKRVKVAPTRYAPVVEDESCPVSPHASSGILLVTRNIILTASPPLENSSATTDEIMVHGSNEGANPGSSEGVSAVAAATRLHKGKKLSFDERFKDLMAFKAECGHCNVPRTNSRDYKHYSLGLWCVNIRNAFKAIKKGRQPNYILSRADMKRLENAGFHLYKTFDERLKDLIAFKSEYGHCNVPSTQSRKNKHGSLGTWCFNVRKSFKAIKKGGIPKYRLSKADMKQVAFQIT